MVFTLGKLERLIFWVAGSQMMKNLDLNVSGTQRDVAPKQRPDRLSSIGDHIQVTPTFEHTWVTPRDTVIESS